MFHAIAPLASFTVENGSSGGGGLSMGAVVLVGFIALLAVVGLAFRLVAALVGAFVTAALAVGAAALGFSAASVLAGVLFIAAKAGGVFLS